MSSLNILTCECKNQYRIIHDDDKQYFNLDEPKEKTILSSEHSSRAMKLLETKTIKKNQQYEVGLLCKDDVPMLPESYQVVSHRLKCLQNTFKKGSHLHQTIQAEINKLISKGSRKVLKEKKTSCEDCRWYLPVFVAINPNKPGKVRLV